MTYNLAQSVPCPPADARPAFDRAQLVGANINPTTWLATDYLNHFNEAIMLLEMLPVAPECKEDFLTWEPRSYVQHFAASNFKFRDLAVAAYEAADPAFRGQLDDISAQMTTILTATHEGMKGDLAPDTIRILAEATTHWLRPLVARAGAVINGETVSATAADDKAPQDAIDLLFDAPARG
ncbi:MAG TPA: hypothetical protein VGG01_16315 [Xanthobacteraceae bacterium]|jgi:hypothetical protein